MNKHKEKAKLVNESSHGKLFKKIVMNKTNDENDDNIYFEPIVNHWKNNKLFTQSSQYYNLKLEDCLEHFTACEELTDKDNLYHCSKCRKKDPEFESEAITRMLIKDPP